MHQTDLHEKNYLVRLNYYNKNCYLPYISLITVKVKDYN